MAKVWFSSWVLSKPDLAYSACLSVNQVPCRSLCLLTAWLITLSSKVTLPSRYTWPS